MFGCIAQGLEHRAYNAGVDGSIPSTPTILKGRIAQLVRVLR